MNPQRLLPAAWLPAALLAAASIAAALGASLLWFAPQLTADSGTSASRAPDWSATGGAAPGYLADLTCAVCHGDLHASYQEVAMARSFYRPTALRRIEDFNAPPFFHAPSKRYYEMVPKGDGLLFRRYQKTKDGQPIHLFEVEVDWILGSGNHSRTYLFRTPSGELYQLPLAWYTQSGTWNMAPGFEASDHIGVTRRVRRECMFCHNAYPDAPVGSDVYGAPHTYPAKLPEGVGCQRCHGPGAEHARLATSGTDDATVRAAIVNPGRLDARRRHDVCYGCHMQPSVAIPGVRRFGRADYSFRPGESLESYRVGVDVIEAGKERSERFEINHHPYRLEQSRCFTASDGALSCLTCHDPHRKVAPEERAAHYRAACLTCHQIDACTLDAIEPASSSEHTNPQDCIACHMPERRTRDVIHVTMTDHRIGHHPDGPELVAPIDKVAPEIVDVVPLGPELAPERGLWEIYRAVAVLRVHAQPDAADRLEGLLAEISVEALDPYLDLTKAQLDLRRFATAEKSARAALERAPGHPLALHWLATALSARGARAEAAATFAKSLEAAPDHPEALFNLGALHLTSGSPAEALAHLQRAVEMRPNLAAAWYYLGGANETLGQLEPAAEAYRRALGVDPTHSRAYARLGHTLAALGKLEEARRYLRHGLDAAADPNRVAQALAALDTPATPPGGP